MKKVISLLAICAVMVPCLTACGNNNESVLSSAEQSSVENTSSVESAEEKEYFAENSKMPKPSESLGAEFIKEDNEIYYYSLSSDSEAAVAAMQIYMADVMSSGLTLEKVEGSTYYNVYVGETYAAIIGLAKDGDDYVMCVSFFD